MVAELIVAMESLEATLFEQANVLWSSVTLVVAIKIGLAAVMLVAAWNSASESFAGSLLDGSWCITTGANVGRDSRYVEKVDIV